MAATRCRASAVIVTVASWDLSIPGSVSLKNKRSVLRSLRDRLGRMNVSVAEAGLQDSRNRARLKVAFLAPNTARADAILASVDQLIEEGRGVVVVANASERL